MATPPLGTPTLIGVGVGPGNPHLVALNPPGLVAGMGCNRGTSREALSALLLDTLTREGLALGSLATITSVDAKGDEPGLVALARQLGVPLVTYPADRLASIEVPHPSAAAATTVGTPSVAEASVIAHGADLVVTKRRTPEATCAIGRLPACHRLTRPSSARRSGTTTPPSC